VHVEVHDRHFHQSAPDVEWLEFVGRQGWIVLTKDEAIRRNHLEREALLEAKVRAFIITAARLSGRELGQLVVDSLGRIRRLTRRQPAPFIARLSRSSVGLIWPT
jgi:hypothetical protein